MKLKRIKNLLIPFLASFFIVACKNENVIAPIQFPSEKVVEFKEMHIGDSLGRVHLLRTEGDRIIVGETNHETQLQIIDTRTMQNYKFGRTGEGPGYLIAAASFDTYNGNLYVCDISKVNVVKYNIDSVLKKGEYSLSEEVVGKSKMPSPFDIGCLNEDIFAVTAIQLGMSRFALIDKKGNEIMKCGSLPPKPQEDISDMIHSFAYYGRLTINKKMLRIAVCTFYSGIMQVYQYNGSDVKLIKEHIGFLADYVLNGGSFGVTDQTRWGYVSMDSNDSHIFALYSGRVQNESPNGTFLLGTAIHVFDWNGNPVQKITFDRQLSQICVTDNLLYGYDVDKEDIVIADIAYLTK